MGQSAGGVQARRYHPGDAFRVKAAGIMSSLGCFVVVAVDSVLRGISPVFWRLAALFGGPFALLAYGIVRTQTTRR